MWVTHPVRCWFGWFSQFAPVRCDVTFPNVHMSHRVTIESFHEHNALIGSLDYDDTCNGCSCKNPHFISDCQRYTLTQNFRCASPAVSSRCMNSVFKRQGRANSVTLRLQLFFAFLGMRALRRSPQLLHCCCYWSIAASGSGTTSPLRLLNSSRRSAPTASSRIAVSTRFRHSSLWFADRGCSSVLARHPGNPGV